MTGFIVALHIPLKIPAFMYFKGDRKRRIVKSYDVMLGDVRADWKTKYRKLNSSNL